MNDGDGGIGVSTEIFRESGYLLEEGVTENLSYSEVKLVIANKIVKTQQAMRDKEIELIKLRNYLSCLEHEDRTVWLLYEERAA